jgi:hypothetical protein
MPPCFVILVQKFVTPALKNVKNTLSMEWTIANDVLKPAENAQRNAVLWQE